MRLAALALLATLTSIIAISRPAAACAPAPPAGLHVDILAEQAVIVWDEATKQQHFIRRADFSTEARSFGFLVPTPSRPTLAEAPDAIFHELEAAIRPPRETRREYEVLWTLCGSLVLAGADREMMGAVQVLERTTVAGWDAAVLAADDADAVAAWLRDHGYAFREELRAWLATYVEAGWIITAFKLGRGDHDQFGTEAVHMTFATDRPFFPYREPGDQGAGAARSLRVFFLARGRHDAALDGMRWPGHALHAAPFAGYDGPPLPGVGEGFWLHAFLDESTTRPAGSELFFAPQPGPEIRLPPDVDRRTTTIPVFLDVIAFVGALAALTMALRRRERPPSAS